MILLFLFVFFVYPGKLQGNKISESITAITQNPNKFKYRPPSFQLVWSLTFRNTVQCRETITQFLHVSLARVSCIWMSKVIFPSTSWISLQDHLCNSGWCATLKTQLQTLIIFSSVCFYASISGAGGTISESSTFLHERVRGANADMSRKRSKYGFKYLSKSICGWLILTQKRVKSQHIICCTITKYLSGVAVHSSCCKTMSLLQAQTWVWDWVSFFLILTIHLTEFYWTYHLQGLWQDMVPFTTTLIPPE